MILKNKCMIENFIYSFYFVDSNNEQSYPIDWSKTQIKTFWEVGPAPSPNGADFGKMAPWMNGEQMTYTVPSNR